jgi:hypothetical protein
MAIAGGGVPATRIYIHLRKLTSIGATCNIPAQVIRSPEEAVAHLAKGGSAIYVDAIHGVGQAAKLLKELGLID